MTEGRTKEFKILHIAYENGLIDKDVIFAAYRIGLISGIEKEMIIGNEVSIINRNKKVIPIDEGVYLNNNVLRKLFD